MSADTPTPGQPLSEADVSLLNCPFCGGPASAEMSVRADTYGEWIAGCDNEQCAPQPYAIGKDKKASIAAWNRRPHAPVSRPGDGVEGKRSFEDLAVMLTKKFGNPFGTDYEQGQNDMGVRMIALARGADAALADALALCAAILKAASDEGAGR